MIIKIYNLKKSFGDKKVFDKFDLEVKENEFVVIVGKSGSGKSTLLNIIGLLDSPTSGDVELFNQKNIKPFSSQASKLLKDKIGYLFQNFGLLEDKTVFYNLMLCIENIKMENKEEKVRKALKEVGLEGYENKKVYKCSGGEQQRVAIARLLLKPCELILADEPTGSLDKENKELIFDMLEKLHKNGKTIIVVSHDLDLINKAERVVEIPVI